MPNNAISANTLFHFTNGVENIINILSKEFSPHYCLEDFRVLGLQANGSSEIAIPMVCFCDLPLFNIKKHLAFYGSYGIGLSKKWGVKYRISPVIYTHRSSTLRSSLKDLIEFADRHADENKSTGKNERASRLLYSYTKPYQGKMWRNGKYTNDRRFYDEREWRYVPDVDRIDLPRFLSKRHFLNKQHRQDANRDLTNNFVLSFTPNDIKYIIIRNENEILPMIRSIEAIKSKYAPEIVKLLTTRIISVDHIDEDF